MKNILLLDLLNESGLEEDDKIDIIRIFETLTDSRKIEILDGWNNIIIKIKESRDQLEMEKEILLIKTIEQIEKELEEYNITKITIN